jgi:MFS family permease
VTPPPDAEAREPDPPDPTVLAPTNAGPAVPSRLLTAPFVALFAAALVFFTAGGITLPVAARFAEGPLLADPAGVGIAIGIYAIAALLLRPVVGWASDRYGRRPLLLVGGVVTAVALGLHLLSTTLPLFVAARGLLGIGEAFFFIAAVAAITDLAPPERQGEAINVGSLAVYLGLALGPTVGETVLGLGSFDAVWLTAAALTAVSVGLSLFVPETAPRFTDPSRAGDPPPRGRLFHPAGLFPGVLILCGGWGMAGFLAFIPLHARDLGLSGAGTALALYAIVVVGLRIVFVKLPDQLGPARLSLLALGATALGLAILGLVPGQVALYVGTAVMAIGIAFFFPGLIAVAVSRVDETERGTVVGTTTLFLDLSFGLAPAVLGIAAGVVGYGGTFVISAGVAALGWALLFARRGTLVRQPARTPAGTLVA